MSKRRLLADIAAICPLDVPRRQLGHRILDPRARKAALDRASRLHELVQAANDPGQRPVPLAAASGGTPTELDLNGNKLVLTPPYGARVKWSFRLEVREDLRSELAAEPEIALWLGVLPDWKWVNAAPDAYGDIVWEMPNDPRISDVLWSGGLTFALGKKDDDM